MPLLEKESSPVKKEPAHAQKEPIPQVEKEPAPVQKESIPQTQKQTEHGLLSRMWLPLVFADEKVDKEASKKNNFPRLKHAKSVYK